MSARGDRHEVLIGNEDAPTFQPPCRTPPIWTWEIQRRTKPLGVKLSGVDFKTESAAKLAGEKALMEFLDRLADEEGNAV